MSERKRRKKTFRKGERVTRIDPFQIGNVSSPAERKVSSPEEMTPDEFKAWRKTPEGKKASEAAETRAERVGTPTWMTMRGFFPHARESSIDKRTEDNLTRKGRGMGTVDKCQLGGEGTAESYKKQLDPKNTGSWATFQRVAIYPHTKAGKAKAEKAADAIREGRDFQAEPAFKGESSARYYETDSPDDEGTAWAEMYEYDMQVRVLAVYCKDVPHPAKYWTVWVGRAQSSGSVGAGGGSGTRQSTGQHSFRPDEYRSGLRGRARTRKGYHSGATANIIGTVACSKCEAPIGENCVTETFPEGKRANPHAARRAAFKDATEEEETE